MATNYRQDMPPKGGYKPIDWAKKINKPKNGYLMFGGFIAFTSAAWAYYSLVARKKHRYEELEMRDARLAVLPLYLAEQQREFLRQLRKNRDEENDLMKDVPGWKTGTLYGEPVYYNIRDHFIRPSTEEYFAHCNYWDKYDAVYERRKH